jgi:hypothetical protein
MRTDREVLELAAKAAGFGGPEHKFRWTESEYPRGSDQHGALWNYIGYMDTAVLWNPLTDDGDALRLAIDKGIQFGLTLEDARGYAECENVYIEFEWDMQRPSDRYEAVRRAIVRVAAESIATKET